MIESSVKRTAKDIPGWKVAVLVLALGAAGCGTPEDVNPGQAAPIGSIAVVAGGEQEGAVGAALPSDVRFRVTNASGLPVPGLTVNLSVIAGNGTIPDSVIVTDQNGEGATDWTLGAASGPQELQARAPGYTPAVATASASACSLVTCDLLASSAPGEWRVLALDTYDNSGQAMHPDVARSSNSSKWYWMTVTPYGNSNINAENPSVFHSANGRYWRIPRGVTNPVVGHESGYLSDPDMVRERETRRFWLYYRQVTNTENVILLTRSFDGAHWDAPLTLFSTPRHEVVSPAIVHDGPHAPWVMWSVNSFSEGCNAPRTTVQRRVSTDGISWGAPSGTDLVQPGQTIWHIDVRWIPSRSEYWAVYNTYPAGEYCATNSLYLARSPDGVYWQTYPSPIVRIGEIDALKDIVYRSTFAVTENADTVRLWVSGAKLVPGEYIWSTATVKRQTEDLFALAETPPQAQHVPDGPTRRRLPPPEPDFENSLGVPINPPPLLRGRP